MPLKRPFLHILEDNYVTKQRAIRYPQRLDEPPKEKNITASAGRDAEYRARLRPIANAPKAGLRRLFWPTRHSRGSLPLQAHPGGLQADWRPTRPKRPLWLP